MPDARLPHILVVDDEALPFEVSPAGSAETRVRTPQAVNDGDLAWTDLVLMDYQLDDWRERDEAASPSLQPRTGLALSAVLRDHVDNRDLGGGTLHYTAFALHTSHLDQISRRLHTTNRTPSVVARLNNLEWAFEKTDPSRFRCATALAAAVRGITEAWPAVDAGGFQAAASQLLGLPLAEDWRNRALDDIVLAQIPMSRTAGGRDGLHLLRWLLHSILPYPTFLLDKHWVAVRLRISPASLEQILGGESQLADDLTSCRYEGILSTFLGSRWWRAAVDQYVWEIRADGARDPDVFHGVLETRANASLERVNHIAPVVCVDKNLQPKPDLCSLEDVVRLVPDLWPAYADSAYAEMDLIRDDDDMRGIVHPLDREK